MPPCPSLTAAGGGASIPRVSILGLLAALVLALGSGCNTECRSLCTAWYDYQRDVCQVLDTDDDRVRCISDYRGSRVSDEELAQCVDREVQVEEIAALEPDEGRDCLCDGDESDCPGDDDDSAGW